MLKVDTFASSKIAKEIGLNAAVVINKLEFWMSMGCGEKVEGVVYIWNPMRVWNEQLPWLSLRHLKRVFKKLVDSEIVFKRKHGKGWDQTRSYGINYSHPIVTKCPNGLGQNVPMDSDKMSQCYNTDTYPKKTTKNTTPVVELRVETSKDPYQTRTRTDGELKEQKVSRQGDYSEAAKWLVDLDEIDRDRIDRYIKESINPKARNPIGYERYVTSQVWRKHMGMPNHCDFEVTMGLKQVSTPHIHTRVVSYEEKMGADISADEEMELLLQQGGLE